MHSQQQQHRAPIKMIVTCVALIATLAPTAHGQRPTYAGSRPSGGHSQKDKYNGSQSPQTGTASAAGGGVVVNRFGETDSTASAIAFGAAQRPPVGMPIIQPQSSYVPLSPAATPPQFSLDNRIGVDATAQGSGASSAAAAGSTSRPLPLPLDAHGDQQLVDQLNRFPVDNRPFWFLNFQAIEAQRNGTAQRGAGGAGSLRGSFQG